MENHLSEEMASLFGGFPFVVDEEGYRTLRLPLLGGEGARMSFVGLGSDYGDIVHAALLEPESYNGQQIEAISCVATLDELVAAYEKGMFLASFPLLNPKDPRSLFALQFLLSLLIQPEKRVFSSSQYVHHFVYFKS